MERTWFPQRNTSDAPNALIKNFLFHLGFPISRKTIETDIKAHKEFPLLSMDALISILDAWGIKSAAFNCESEQYSNIPIPGITYIHVKSEEVKKRIHF